MARENTIALTFLRERTSMGLRSLALLLLGAIAPQASSFFCQSDADCSLNGACKTVVAAGGRRWSKSCACDAPVRASESTSALSALVATPAPPGPQLERSHPLLRLHRRDTTC